MFFYRIKRIFPAAALAAVLTVSSTGCGAAAENGVSSQETSEASASADTAAETSASDTSASETGDSSDTDADSEIDTDITGNYSDSDLDADWSDSESDSAFIRLTDGSAEITGKNSDDTECSGSVITITQKGTYVLSGTSSEARIIVDAGDDDDVQLVLNGVNISCSENSPILIKNASKAYITLADGTENSVIDTRAAADDSDDAESDDDSEKEYSAAIFSKCDLTFNGNGTLSVQGGYSDGIKSKKDLKFVSGVLSITASDDGITGKNSVSVREGSITVDCGDDCIRSTDDDSDKGFIVIDDGTLTLTCSSGHGMTAVNTVCINSGSVDITNSYEGIESRYVVLNDGNVNIYSTDDGINISADTSDSETSSAFDMPGEDMSGSQDNTPGQKASDASASPQAPDSSDGSTAPKAPDSTDGSDAVPTPKNTDTADTSASADTSDTSDSSAPGSHGHGGMGHGMGGGNGMGGGFMGGDGIEGSLIINGGTLTVNACGDGLDSNGDIQINGGYTVVSGSTDGGNAALDYATGCTMTGGVLLLSGNRSMATYLDEDSTVTMLNGSADSNLEAGSEISLLDSDGNVIYTWTADKKCNYLQVAGTEIDSSGEYTYLINGTTSIEAVTDESAGGFGGGHDHF